MIVAIFVFSSVMVALFNMWATQARGMAASRDHIVASYLLAQKMEESVSLGWTAEDQPAAITNVAHIAKGQEINVEYWTEVKVEDHSGASDVGLKSITVRVWWEDNGHHELKSTTAVFWQS